VERRTLMERTKAEKFCDRELDGVYRAIRERRDVRSGFLPEALSDEILLRLLAAAHHAPSVGLMQPWRFIVIRSRQVRGAVRDLFSQAQQLAAESYEGDRAELYRGLKLEGILEAPQNLCIVCDPVSERGHRLGRQSVPETAVYSAVCAVQNLWLAARAEGVGVGWVSILDPEALKVLLGIPTRMVMVAYLCIGYVDGFQPSPELERVGWEQRVPLSEVIRLEHYDGDSILAEKSPVI
jgi:5,6-dimethylbenzimidazole synthase